MNELDTIDAWVVHSAGLRPDALALADAPNRADFFGGEPQRLTWADVDAAIDSAASMLLDAGAGPGSAVGIQLPNVVELPVTLLACFRIGAVAVPFPIQHRSHELRHGVETAGIGMFVTSARPDRPDQVTTVAALMAEHGSGPVLEPAALSGHDGSVIHTPGDPATVCWTSGTTGTPKGVPRSHSMWLASSSFQVSQLAIDANDRILCPFPVVNMAGIGGMLVPWTQTGAALFLHQPLDLPVFLGQVQGERITYTVVPPAALNRLLADEAMLERIDLSSIRAISSGSAPLDPWMVEGWQQRGVEIVNVFGSNEGASLLSTASSVPDPTQRARFFPRPDREGVSTRLVDLDTGGEITSAGIPGELRFKGTTVFEGYLGSTGEEFDEDGFYRTGDMFELAGDADPPQLLRFVDRAKDIIIRGGMNISAAEMEALISDHADIVECAAVGYPDRDLGERMGVFAVATPGSSPSLEDLVAHLRERDVASYKLPERLELIAALPRNPVGKVVKPELRSRWERR